MSGLQILLMALLQNADIQYVPQNEAIFVTMEFILVYASKKVY